MTTDVGEDLPDIGLFTGVPQHPNFCRMDEFARTTPLTASTKPLPWPVGEPLSLPEHYTFDGTARSTEAFFTKTDTAALLVLQDGKVRHEQYALTGGPTVPWLSMSVAKSFISAMVGIAIAEGLIGGIHEPLSQYVPVAEGSAYDGVAIKDVLQMSSGARWSEDYSDPSCDVFRLGAATFGTNSDLNTFVANMVPDTPPGTICQYNSGDTQALGALLARATGRSVTQYMQEKLVEPLGMESPGFWVVDHTGVEMAYGGLNLAARDYARLGELYRNGGVWHGQQLVPADWVRASVVASEPHLEPGMQVIGDEVAMMGYGYQWWLSPGDRGQFTGIGVYNQFVFVDPPSRTTIVKLSGNRTYGTSPHEATNQDDETVLYLDAIARSIG